MTLEDQIQIADLSTHEVEHRYCLAVPHVLLDPKIGPHLYVAICLHFLEGSPLILKDWEYLESIDVAEKHRLSDQEILSIIQSKKAQSLPMGNGMCDWCLGTTVRLHSHHYPIKRCDGGKETVNICPNCHYEYHHLSDMTYRIKEQYRCEVVR